MEPYVAMLDFRLFNDHSFLELSLDAQARFVQLIGTCDRMGVANLYQIWNSSRIKPSVMTSLYESKLVWEVDPYYCFIPSVYHANHRMRSGKYKANFDAKGFQACINRYPEIVQSMADNELNFIQSKGIILPITAPLLNAPEQKTDDKPVDPLPEPSGSEEFMELCGEKVPRVSYWQCQLMKNQLRDLNNKYQMVVLTESQAEEWFMEKYHKGFTVNGNKITDITALFAHYCDQIVFNKMVQGKIPYTGANNECLL